MSSKNVPDPPRSSPGRRSRPRSLAYRLTVWYALSSFALVLGATGYLYWALATNLDRENDRFLADQALPLVNLLRDQPADRTALRRQIELAWTARPDPSIYFRVLDEQQRPIADTPGMGLTIPMTAFPEPQVFDRNTVQGQNFRMADEHPFRILAVNTGSTPSFIIQVAMDRGHAEELLADYRRNLGLVLGVALLACALGGYQIARRGVRPVHDIAEAAGRIRSSTLQERIGRAHLPAELRSLADTFNEMLDRLESSFARLAQFTADIAHELRTPINNLRGEAEVALSRARTPAEYQDLLGSALEEYARLSRLIDSLLFLARAENPAHQIQRETVDLRRELECVREFYEAAAAEAGVGLTVSCSEKLVGQLDRTLLQRLLANLVSNALRHTPAQGSITLSAKGQDGGLQIEVADTGSGIAPVHLARLCERFYRVDGPANPGKEGNVGLGLAIVKTIAELHGGSVAIASEVDAGTKVTLAFPMTKL
jgi:two-component system heavy metal sensor histidine kinase CusS